MFKYQLFLEHNLFIFIIFFISKYISGQKIYLFLRTDGLWFR